MGNYSPVILFIALVFLFFLLGCQTPKPVYSPSVQKNFRSIPDFFSTQWLFPQGEHKDRFLEYLEFFHFPRKKVQARIVTGSWGRVFSLKFTPTEKRGQVFIIHGYMAHLGHHSELTQRLLADQWEVVLIDLPGHGLSDGKRFDIDAFSTYGHVLSSIWLEEESSETPLPRIMIGHSTGASTILEALLSIPEEHHPSGIIFGAPLVEMYQRGFRTTVNHLAWSNQIPLPEIFRNPRFMSSGASCNPEFRTFALLGDPLYAWIYSPGWLHAYDHWIKELLHDLNPRYHGPALVLQGSADTTVDGMRNEPLLKILLPKNEYLVFDGYSHTIFNVAPDRLDRVYERIQTFLPQ